MRFRLSTLVIVLLAIVPVRAGKWTVSPQPEITKETTPKEPKELKQPASLEDEKGFKIWYAGYWGGQNLYLANSDKDGSWPQSGIRACVFNGLNQAMLVSSPCVVRHEAGYMMWFTYSPNWPGPWKVGMASSFNGIEWENSKLNPVLEPAPDADDSGSIQDVSVLKVEQTWHLWYSCQKKNDWKVEIFHATSADGIKWERKGKINFDTFYPGLVMDPCVLRKDNGYVMFYVTIQGEDKPTLRSAISEDGQTWKSDYLPPLEDASSPTIARDGEGWRAWFIRGGNIWSAKYKP